MSKMGCIGLSIAGCQSQILFNRPVEDFDSSTFGVCIGCFFRCINTVADQQIGIPESSCSLIFRKNNFRIICLFGISCCKCCNWSKSVPGNGFPFASDVFVGQLDINIRNVQYVFSSQYPKLGIDFTKRRTDWAETFMSLATSTGDLPSSSTRRTISFLYSESNLLWYLLSDISWTRPFKN